MSFTRSRRWTSTSWDRRICRRCENIVETGPGAWQPGKHNWLPSPRSLPVCLQGRLKLIDNQVAKFDRPNDLGSAAPAQDPPDDLVQPIHLKRQRDGAVLVLADF